MGRTRRSPWATSVLIKTVGAASAGQGRFLKQRGCREGPIPLAMLARPASCHSPQSSRAWKGQSQKVYTKSELSGVDPSARTAIGDLDVGVRCRSAEAPGLGCTGKSF